MNIEKIKFIVETDESAYGDTDGVNMDASLQKLGEMTEAQLKADYPNAEIEWDYGHKLTHVTVYSDDDDIIAEDKATDDVVRTIENIILEFNWVVTE